MRQDFDVYRNPKWAVSAPPKLALNALRSRLRAVLIRPYVAHNLPTRAISEARQEAT